LFSFVAFSYGEQLASEINAYMATTLDLNEEIVNVIKKRLGVTVNQHFQSCGEIEAKLIAEAPRFNADMVLSTCSPGTFIAKKEGWTIPYISPTWQQYGKEWRDPDGHYYLLGNYSSIVVGNKKLLAKKGYKAPQSWDDLIDPKWKGQIVVPSALTSGNGFQILYTAMTLYGFNKGKGENGGWEYLKALDKNIDHYTKSGSAPIELVSRGEFMVGIGSNNEVLKRMQQGYPIMWVVPKEGIGFDGVLTFILKGTKKLYTCQKIVDLLGTKEISKLFSSYGGYVTKDPTVADPLFKGIPKYIKNINLEWAITNKRRLTKEWKERILRK
jgi:iron(III) transport system substrate-binding protein